MIITLDKVKIAEKDILFRLLQYSLFEESETDMNEMIDNIENEYFMSPSNYLIARNFSSILIMINYLKNSLIL